MKIPHPSNVGARSDQAPGHIGLQGVDGLHGPVHHQGVVPFRVPALNGGWSVKHDGFTIKNDGFTFQHGGLSIEDDGLTMFNRQNWWFHHDVPDGLTCVNHQKWRF